MTTRPAARGEFHPDMTGPINLDALDRLTRERRRRTNLSLRAAAEESGVPFNTLARVEKGHLPDLGNFRRLVNWIGLPPEKFLQPDRARTESTVELIAGHLAEDPCLTPAAAEQITGLVRQLYDTLATQQTDTKVHVHAAETLTPAAADLLGSILADIQHAVEHEPDSADGSR